MDGTEDPARWRETGEKFELFDTSSLLYSLGRGVLEKKKLNRTIQKTSTKKKNSEWQGQIVGREVWIGG
jgi:hypothetical protein